MSDTQVNSGTNPNTQTNSEALKSQANVENKGKAESKSSDTPTFEDQLKQRDGTISALTRKLNDIESQNKRMLDGFKTSLGIEDNAEEKDERTRMQRLTDTIAELKSEAQKGKADKLIRTVLNSWEDENGNQLSDDIKEFLLEDIELNEPNEQVLRDTVQKKLGRLTKTIIKTTNDSASGSNDMNGRPNRSSYVGVNGTGNKKTANEILQELKEKGK